MEQDSLISQQSNVKVSQDNWVVAMARMRGDEHAFLLLEGINEEGECVLFQAGLFVDGRPFFSISGLSLAGTVKIDLKYLSLEEIEDLTSNAAWQAKSWEIYADHPKPRVMMLKISDDVQCSSRDFKSG